MPIFVTHEHLGFRLAAFYGESHAHVYILRDGMLHRMFEYPAYRIWNVSAHFEDMVYRELAAEGSAQ